MCKSAVLEARLWCRGPKYTERVYLQIYAKDFLEELWVGCSGHP